MAIISHVGTSSGGPASHMAGITDVTLRITAQGLRVYTTNAVTGGILAWNADGALPLVIDRIDYAPMGGLSVPMGLEFCEIGGTTALVAFGQAAAGAIGAWVAADGKLSDPFGVPVGAGALLTLEAMRPGGLEMFYTSARDSAGISCWSRDAGGTVVLAGTIAVGTAQSGNERGMDVLALAQVTVAGTSYLLATSAADTCLTSFRVSATGGLTPVQMLGTRDGLSIAMPTLLEPVQLMGQDYVLLGAAGSSSIVVMAMAADGTLRAVDQVNDDLNTRFQGISVLKAVTLGDRVFVIAGGSDDGLSLMTLLPGGRLLHLESLADSAAMALNNVSALDAVARNGAIEVFVTDQTSGALTQLRIDPGALGATQVAGAAAAILQGGAQADLLVGGNGNDKHYGGAGADILIDGAGADQIWGGAGADVFVFALDGKTDQVMDFEVGIDRLDLSALGRFYSKEALTFTQTANGLDIRFGDELVRLIAADGKPIDPARLKTADLTDLWHLPTAPLPIADRKLTGTVGSDTLLGGPGADVLIGGLGADYLSGGAGDDLILGQGVEAGFDPLAAQVCRLYLATLDRVPDQAGLLDWTGCLAAGQPTLAGVATGFVGSAEFQSRYGATSNTQFVTLLYNNVLDRAPDAGGLTTWTGRLASGAMSRAEVVLGFSESPEFARNTAAGVLDFSRAGLQADWSDEVYRLYQATLGRAPDANGFLNWTSRLAQGQDFLDTVNGFVGSPEFQSRYGATSNTQFVTLLYANVLDRAPDAGGLASWTGRLDSGAMSRAEVVRGFAQSPEFIRNTTPDLIDWMRAKGLDDVLIGGPGNDILMGGIGADTFVFSAADAGHDTVAGFEAWDGLRFDGFGYASAADALDHMTQAGTSVHFVDQGVEITFTATLLAQITSATIEI